MPVQVPTLNRFNAQPEASVGRIDYTPADVTKPMEVQAGAAERLAGAAEKQYIQAEHNAAITTATAAASEYHRHLEDGLEGPQGVKRVKGDPTEAYKYYDEKAAAKKEEILGKYSDASDLVKSTIAAKLNDTDNKFYDRKTTAFGNQVAVYRSTVAKDSVELTKNDMMDATTHLDIKDPHALVPLDAKISEILDTRTQEGIANGTVTKDKDGNYIYSASAKLQIAKDTSDGLTKTISNLIASGDVEGAKFLTEKYSGYLDAVNKPKIEEKTQKAFKDQSAMNEFDAVRNLSGPAAIAKLEKIEDPKIREKALENFDTHQRRMKNIESRSAKDNYNQIGKIILNRQNSGDW